MEVILSLDARKQLKRLPKSEQHKVAKKLIELRNNPLAGKKLSGDLTNRRSLRAWPYRIIYKISKNTHKVEVSDILHRQGAYK